MIGLLKSEWIKIKRTKIGILLLLTPLMAGGIGAVAPIQEPIAWRSLLVIFASVHALVFFPLMIGIFSAFLCRYEHQHNGWKQLFTMPVARRNVFMAKLVVVIGFAAINQLLLFAVYFSVGLGRGLGGNIPFEFIFRSMAGGWIAVLPLAALTLWVAVMLESFAIALTVNVIFTLPNIFAINTEAGRLFYPWAQPFVMMIPQGDDSLAGIFVSVETLLVAIIGSLLIFLIGGIISIERKAV